MQVLLQRDMPSGVVGFGCILVGSSPKKHTVRSASPAWSLLTPSPYNRNTPYPLILNSRLYGYIIVYWGFLILGGGGVGGGMGGV